MPVEEVVRPFQLPGNAPEQIYLSQYNLPSNAPIYVTPGFGGSGNGNVPLISGSAHIEVTETYYCPQGSSERGSGQQAGGGF